jgi:hypothetical protein
MSFSALDRYYVKLFEVNLDFLFFIVKKHLNNMARQYTIQCRYDNVTLIPLVLQLGLRIGPIQRMGAN